MKLSGIVEVKKQCKEDRKTIEGSDCNKCPLGNDILLKLDVGSNSSDGILAGLTLKVNPCLLLDGVATAIKKLKG